MAITTFKAGERYAIHPASIFFDVRSGKSVIDINLPPNLRVIRLDKAAKIDRDSQKE